MFGHTQNSKSNDADQEMKNLFDGGTGDKNKQQERQDPPESEVPEFGVLVSNATRRAGDVNSPMHFLGLRLKRNPVATKAYLDKAFESGSSRAEILACQTEPFEKIRKEIIDAWLRGEFDLKDIEKEFRDRQKLRLENLSFPEGTARILARLESDPKFTLRALDPDVSAGVDKMVTVISETILKIGGQGSDKLTQQRAQEEAALTGVCLYVGVGTTSVGLILCPKTKLLLQAISYGALQAQRIEAIHRLIATWRDDPSVHDLYRQFGILITGLLVRLEVQCGLLRHNFSNVVANILNPDNLLKAGFLKEIESAIGSSARELFVMCLTLARLHGDHAHDKNGYPSGMDRMTQEIETVYNFIDRILYEEPGVQAQIGMKNFFSDTSADQASSNHKLFLLKSSPSSSSSKYEVMYAWARIAGQWDAGKYVEMESQLGGLTKALTPAIFLSASDSLFSSSKTTSKIVDATVPTPSKTQQQVSQQQQKLEAKLDQLTNAVVQLGKNTAVPNNSSSGSVSNQTSMSSAGSRRVRQFYCENHPNANSHNTEDCHPRR